MHARHRLVPSFSRCPRAPLHTCPGASYGQELPPSRMEAIIRAAARVPVQRTTLYGRPPPAQVARSFVAAGLAPLVTVPAGSGGGLVAAA